MVRRTVRVSSLSGVLLFGLAACATNAQHGPVAEPTASAMAPAPSAEPSATAAAPSAEPSASAVASAAPSAPPPAEPSFAPLPAMPTNLHAPPQPWARMNARQKDQYMESAVLPAMRAMFREYDPQHFASARCGTCHGANMRQTHFHMPNPTLPALARWGTPEARAQHDRDPRMMAFMGQRVVPAMAQLLGVEPYNPQTHQGFGCMSCHTNGPPAAGASAAPSAAPSAH